MRTDLKQRITPLLEEEIEKQHIMGLIATQTSEITSA